MPRTGRPKLVINQDLFEDLCRIQCTMPEIIGVLRVSEETLRRWVKRTYGDFTFETIRAQKAEGGKASLRRAQINLALEAANPTMLIWLGKQYLAQADKQNLEVTITDDREIAEAALQPWLEAGYSKAEAVEQCKQHVPEVAKLASELVQ